MAGTKAAGCRNRWSPGLKRRAWWSRWGLGVTHLKVGQRVATICQGGGYGDLLVVSAAQAVPLPDSISDEVGGTFPMTGFTAWHLVHTAAKVQPGDTVLVHAAAGGVGTMLLQLAKRGGATVFGTVGSDDKIDTAKRFGADHVINYQRENFADAVRTLTGGRGVDVVIDGVGAATCRDDVKALRPFGRLVSFGRASGPAQLTGDDLQPKSLQWSHFGVFTAYQQPDIWNRGVASLVPLIDGCDDLRRAIPSKPINPRPAWQGRCRWQLTPICHDGGDRPDQWRLIRRPVLVCGPGRVSLGRAGAAIFSTLWLVGRVARGPFTAGWMSASRPEQIVEIMLHFLF